MMPDTLILDDTSRGAPIRDDHDNVNYETVAAHVQRNLDWSCIPCNYFIMNVAPNFAIQIPKNQIL